jgi:hypothetical protein
MFLIKLVPLFLSLALTLPNLNKDPLEPNPNKPLGNVITIEESVLQFEKAFNKEVLLPKYLPFTPTDSGGNFYKNEQRLTVDYLNRQTGELCSLHIYNREFHLNSETAATNVKLTDGTKASYIHNSSIVADFIKFKKAELTYLLGISKNNSPDKSKLNDLLKIANSLVTR